MADKQTILAILKKVKPSLEWFGKYKENAPELADFIQQAIDDLMKKSE